MIDLDNTRTAIVKGLRAYLNLPVIRSNQTGEIPPYPYLSYTITSLANANNGTWGKYDDGLDRKPVTQSWSITVQSDNAAESMRLALKAHEWLDHVGTVALNDLGVIVQSLSGITNRDNMITVEYEYRNGFDAVLWCMNEVDDTTDEIGTIEYVAIDGNFVEPSESLDELNEKLEKRLDGVL